MDSESSDNSFSLERFSTHLLVECVLLHLETISTPRGYVGTNVASNNFYNDNSKKWVRLSETLFQCMKNDIKGWKANSQKTPYDRNVASDIISQWFPDLDQLKSLYEQLSTKTNEIECLYAHIEILHTLSCHIYERQKQKDMEAHGKKDEVVFVYDDNNSSPVFLQ